jgi:hypothetical protein
MRNLIFPDLRLDIISGLARHILILTLLELARKTTWQRVLEI